jgi:malonyl-CoA O-methyltransferase
VSVVDRRAVASHFSRAAKHYDAAAVLQKEVSERLSERLPLLKIQPGCIVDLGAGTGFLSEQVRSYYPQATLIAVDLSAVMLAEYRNKLLAQLRWWHKFNPFYSARPAVHLVSADAYQLPLADNSVDMLVSSLMLQWCDDLPRVLAECRRVLRQDGVFFIATLGPDTLKELRSAWQVVDGQATTHLLNFADLHDLGDALSHAGFSDPVCDVEHITLTYADAASAVKDLKAIGATNANQQRTKGLMGKQKWQQFLQAYQQSAMADGRIPATFEVVYAHAFIAEKKTVDNASPITAVIPVDAIKRWQGR